MHNDFSDLIEMYRKQIHLFKQFKNVIVDCFVLEPSLNTTTNPTIHSIKARLKDPDHLAEKIARKLSDPDAEPITTDNFFSRITDLSGVRVLHLYQDQFPKIHEFIDRKIREGDWYLAETPKAYSWDPEAREFFEKLGLEVKLKESHYTSIHYLIKPKPDSIVCCEIQVRTLFEEIWGEIDHTINYPSPSQSRACKEQLRVLSKLVSTGTRLADSIFRVHSDPQG
ncbi:(p)ppGpp synthetase [Noviherbaspirillum sp. ST9]|uniref:(p)ppGpp synthetase n=1 Tax=Noviherbaspirillum sp. ST9 TaxID=3401606 RepID=UPI003B586F07